MPILLQLFLIFLKIGAVSFGGGYAMIPLIKDEIVSFGWLTESEVINFIAVAESTPGPIAINMATFIGASQGGILGAMLATLGIILPSIIIILLIASLINGLLKFAGVKAFLTGARPVIVGLIISTAISLFISVIIGVQKVGDSIEFDYKALIIFTLIATISIVYKKVIKKSISPILLIVVSACLGMLLYGLIP